MSTDDPWNNPPASKPQPAAAQPPGRHPLLDGRVADVRKNIAALDDPAVLKALHVNESAQEKPRSTVITSIEERIAKLGPKVGPVTEAKAEPPAPPKPAPSPVAPKPPPTAGPKEPYAVFHVSADASFTIEYPDVSAMYAAVGAVAQRANRPGNPTIIQTPKGQTVVHQLLYTECVGSAGLPVRTVNQMKSYTPGQRPR